MSPVAQISDSSLTTFRQYLNVKMDNTYSPGSFDHLETALVSSSVASVTFDVSSYAALGYKHLQIRSAARLSTSFTERTINMRFNGDTGSNYTAHYIQSNGSTPASGSETPSSRFNLASTPAANATANAFGGTIIDIVDAFATTKNKTVRVLGANDTNAIISLRSGAWLNTSAITSIELAEYFSSSNFVSGSRFSLYGLKG